MPLPARKLLVFGGNGFVGQAIMKAGLQKGLECIGISRRGEPTDMMHDLEKEPNFTANVKWRQGDVMDLLKRETPGHTSTGASVGGDSEDASWMNDLSAGDTAVVSCIGMFSTSNKTMKEINGDGNAALARYSKEHGALRFVYISAYEVEKDLPFALLPGYVVGILI